jgi:hypothetical protein
MHSLAASINIIGHAGSGKSAVCEHLANKYGYVIYRPSDLIREQAPRFGIELKSRKDYVRCHELLIAENPDAMIQPVLDSASPLICVDGMRSVYGAEKLRQGGMHIIALDGDAALRYGRVVSSGRNGHRKPPSFEAFVADEQADKSSDPHLPNTQAVMDMADYHVDISQPLDDVLRALDKIVEEISHTPSQQG